VTVTVIGVDGTTLAPGGRAALAKATLVVGARRHLDAFGPRGVPAVELTALDSVVTALYREHGADRHTAVLVPGDPAFFGIVKGLRDNGIDVQVRPALSAVQRLAAMTGRPWDDMAVVDAGGGHLRKAVNVCRARKSVAVFTAPGAGPTEIGAGLAGWRRNLVIAEEIGSPRESLSTVDANEAANRLWREPNVVFCLAETAPSPHNGWYAGGEPGPPANGWALDEAEFAHREGTLQAPEVRAVALARLAPRPGTLVWDIGAGSGDVAVECARFGAAVIAVDADAGQGVRVMANAARHEVDVRLVDGKAPEALRGLPAPDSVFLGGGGPYVLKAVAATRASRIVLATTHVAALGELRKVLQDNGYTVDGCQFNTARLQPRSDRMRGQDPAFLLCASAP
jgi:precorrin-6Y C5,15-methyltransferase (decarboxylating)